MFDYGGVVGMVDVIDCCKGTDSPWHQRGAIGWVLAKPRRLKFRPCKGVLGLFRPDFKRAKRNASGRH